MLARIRMWLVACKCAMFLIAGSACLFGDRRGCEHRVGAQLLSSVGRDAWFWSVEFVGTRMAYLV